MDSKYQIERVASWIAHYFAENGTPDTKAIVGISGGIDSAVVAALCVKALGKENVIGVQLPNKEQSDFDIGEKLIEHLDIKKIVFNIGPTMDGIYLGFALHNGWNQFNEIVRFNTPARIRMSILYLIAAQLHGRVANTCNLSETYVGYDTKWGDNTGDFAPIQNFTKTEVRELAKALKLPEYIITKAPDDGMCGQTDEERFGFTYDELDEYIRHCVEGPNADKIEYLNTMAQHKISSVTLPHYEYPDPLDDLY